LETSPPALTSLPASRQTATAYARCYLLWDSRFTPQSSEPMEKLWDCLLVSCVIWWKTALTFEAEFQEVLKSYQPQGNFSCTLTAKWPDTSLWECATQSTFMLNTESKHYFASRSVTRKRAPPSTSASCTATVKGTKLSRDLGIQV